MTTPTKNKIVEIAAVRSSDVGPSFGPCVHVTMDGETLYRGYDLADAAYIFRRKGGDEADIEPATREAVAIDRHTR